MGEILFIAHRIPFPPDRGDKIRSHHVLRALAKQAPVHVACFGEGEHDMAGEQELAQIAVSHKLVRRSKPLVLAGGQAVLRRMPVSLTAFHDRTLASYINQVIATRPISAIYVFSGQMGQYVPDSFSGRVVMDFVDADSAKFEAYARTASRPMAWIHSRENQLLRNEEARLAARADVSLLISNEEAALFQNRLTPPERATARIAVMGNGLDSTFFDPALATSEPHLANHGAPRLVFTGQMDYAPNVSAAIRAIDRIMPLVRVKLPQASFHVVGRKPLSELLSRNGHNGAQIWGGVDDIRPWLAGADMALVPLEIARGVQNKVLEAMAMGLPVVLTSGAATGIPAQSGRHFTVADDDAQVAEAVIALASDPERASTMGKAARRFVLDHASWQTALEPLPQLMGLSATGSRHAA